jgi:hypothetical protein
VTNSTAKIDFALPPKIISPTQIASVDATFNDPGSVSAAFGIKRKVKVPGTEAKVELEIVGVMSINDFHSLINNRPFSVTIEAKVKGQAGPVDIEFKGEIQAAFPAITSIALPKISATGHVFFGNGQSPVRVGAGWKWDDQGPGLTGGLIEQKEKRERELSDPTDTVGAEGKINVRFEGNRDLALRGAFGGPQASGTNRITISGEGKVYLNLFPTTFQVISPAGLVLKITNDGENGIWRVRLPSGQVIGQLDLPKLSAKVEALGEKIFKNIVTEARKLAEVSNIFKPPTTSGGVDRILNNTPQAPQIPEGQYKPAERLERIPVGQTTSHPDLVAKAIRLPNSYWAAVVRGLDKVALASSDSDFAKKINVVMQSNTTHDESINGTTIRYSRDGGTLRATSLDPQGQPVAYANVTYNRRTGALSWKPVNLDKAIEQTQTVAQIGSTTTHDNLVKLAKQKPDSYNAYVVRGLDKVLLAAPNSELSRDIKRVMGDSSGKTVKDDNINGVSVRYSNFRGSLRVAALDDNGKEMAFATVTYDSRSNKLFNRKTGKPSWTEVNLDRAPTNQRTNGAADITNPVVYGLDRDLIAAARSKGPNSDAGLVVWGLNEVAAAGVNSPFRNQIDRMMARGKPVIEQNFTDAQGKNVSVQWSKTEGRLQVKVTREGSAPTLHRVNYPNGNWWTVTNVSRQSGRTADDLGNVNTITAKASANPQSREARVLYFADLVYLNAAASDGQGKRDLLKQLSRQGYYVDKTGKVQFEVTYSSNNGDSIALRGGEGRITLTVTPSNPKAHAYSMRMAVNDKGVPVLQGSAERTKDLRRADSLVPSATVDLADYRWPRHIQGVGVIAQSQELLATVPTAAINEPTGLQAVRSHNQRFELSWRTDTASNGVQVIDPRNSQVVMTYKPGTTPAQIRDAMSPGSPLHGIGVPVQPIATNLQPSKQQDLRQPALSV